MEAVSGNSKKPLVSKRLSQVGLKNVQHKAFRRMEVEHYLPCFWRLASTGK